MSNFHVSGILETSKRSNKLNCQVEVAYALETSEPYSGDLGSESDAVRLSRALSVRSGSLRQFFNELAYLHRNNERHSAAEAHRGDSGWIMSIDVVRKALLGCAVINYGILLVWFLFFVLGHDGMYLLHRRWFRLSVEQFDMLHYAGMSIFKIGILLLNLIPYIALHIMRRVSL